MIGVLAHESLHTAGVRDEGAAECYSLQLTTRAATWLSGDIDYAQRSAELSWGYFRDFWDGTMYDDQECRQHGELDLGIAGASWSA